MLIPKFSSYPAMPEILNARLICPKKKPVGIALLAHPHPLYGGTMNNKVVQMMARSLLAWGFWRSE